MKLHLLSYVAKTVTYLQVLTLSENDGNVYYDGNVEGDVIGVGVVVTGRSNIIGRNITVNKQYLEIVSSEYAESLSRFIEFKIKYTISPEQAKSIQNIIYDLMKVLKAQIQRDSLLARFGKSAGKGAPQLNEAISC
jgi:hypothetical protein